VVDARQAPEDTCAWCLGLPGFSAEHCPYCRARRPLLPRAGAGADAGAFGGHGLAARLRELKPLAPLFLR
jgi:hypothetical protein